MKSASLSSLSFISRMRSNWQRYPLRWITSAGVVLVVGSFSFVFFSFLALQLQTFIQN